MSPLPSPVLVIWTSRPSGPRRSTRAPSSTWCRCATACRTGIDVYCPTAWPVPRSRAPPLRKNGRYCWMPFLARPSPPPAATPSCRRTSAASSAPRERPTRSCNEIAGRLRHDRVDARQPWSDGEVACGATRTTASRSGPRSRPAIPALKAIVPRVTSSTSSAGWRGDAALRRALPGRVLDGPPHARAGGRLEPRPLAEVFDPGFEAIGSR